MLSNPDPGIIVTHIAEATHQVGILVVIAHSYSPNVWLTRSATQHFAYEAVFKSLNRLLVDNASSEYVFIAEFFQSPRLRLVQAKSANGAVVAAMTFVGVFGSTLELLLVRHTEEKPGKLMFAESKLLFVPGLDKELC